MKSDKFDFNSHPAYKVLTHFLIENNAYINFLYNFKRTKRFSEAFFYNPDDRLPHCINGMNQLYYLINDAFTWNRTIEGYSYWNTLAQRAKKYRC